MRKEIILNYEGDDGRATISVAYGEGFSNKFCVWTDGCCYLKADEAKVIIKEIDKTIGKIKERTGTEIRCWNRAKELIRQSNNFKDLEKYIPNETEQYQCQSYVEGGVVENCTCGKCF